MTKISNAEGELMKLIWEHAEPITCAELLQRLPDGRCWKTTTVLTFLSRLAEKGMVSVQKNGKTNVYSAAVTEEAYLAGESQSFLENMHGGSVKSFIAALHGSGKLTQGEIAELRDWLNKQ